MRDEQSKSISSIRVIAMFMIVTCHIYQGLDNELAWWFNIGVQVFLCMSGFLLAHSVYSDWKSYLWKRIKRLICPYYILLVVVIPIYILEGIKITWVQVVSYCLGIQGTVEKAIPGLGHLWFITTIILCYILLIGVNKFKRLIVDCNEIIFYVRLSMVCVFIQSVCIVSGIGIDNGAWIATFFIGYFLSTRYGYKIPNKLIYLFIPIVCITTGIRIYFSYVQEIQIIFIEKIFEILFIPWSKVLLGCFIFILLYKIFSIVYVRRKLNNGVMFFSNISYEVYLVHQVLILGPLSLLNLTSSLFINIGIILILVASLSYLLHLSSEFINLKLFNKGSINTKQLSRVRQVC